VECGKPWADGNFDAVISTEGIEHLENHFLRYVAVPDQISQYVLYAIELTLGLGRHHWHLRLSSPLREV
jgi:hypothetical protein